MPSVANPSYSATKRFGPEEKPSITCIATHAYWRQSAQQKELSYTTSFQKPQEYIDRLREEVNDGVFRRTIDDNITPVYAFEELKGIYHTPEYPLIHKGLLASTKYEQHAGYTTPVEKPLPVNKPRPLPPNRSFYRPNSTHNYLTKTIALGGSHDGFDPKHGTPTRAQLLRNRGKFTSAPDLTYTYVGQRKADGKHEAVHRKAKMAEEALRLKANKIEMDRTAAKYRQFVIGSAYNTSKWVDSHMRLVGGVMAARNSRPASSVTPKVTPMTSNAKRRAASAVANNEHLRNASTTSGKRGETLGELPGRQTRPSSCKELSVHGRDVSSRSPNMRPYSASINSRSVPSHLNASIVITSAAVQSAHSQDDHTNTRGAASARAHSAVSSKATRQADSVQPTLAVSLRELQADEVASQSSKTTARASSTSRSVFLTSDRPTNINNNSLDLTNNDVNSQPKSTLKTEAEPSVGEVSTAVRSNEKEEKLLPSEAGCSNVSACTGSHLPEEMLKDGVIIKEKP